MRNAIVLVFMLAAACASVIKSVRPPRQGQFPMPDLTGKSKSQAEETLAVEGKTGALDVQETDCRDEAVKEGTVCGQTPEPGQTTQAGGPTVIYLQKKRDPKMPDVIGKDAEEAKRILADVGFRNVDVRTLERPRPGCTPKRVCATSPEPGVRASPGVMKTLFLQPDAEAAPATRPSDPDATQPREEKPKEEKPPESIF